ncbi:hypothetical protein LPJ53_006334, partial [Coemansia erecta]
HNFAQFLGAFVDAAVGRVGRAAGDAEAEAEAEAGAGAEAQERGAMASLTRNYRSHQSIVDLGNIVARDTGRGSALLARLRVPLTAQPSAPVVPVAVWASRTGADEARAIVRRIAGLLAAGDCRAADIAVISRVLNFGSYRPTDLIERELLRQGIAFVVRGGASGLRSARMQRMMALVRCVANPRDDVAAATCLEAFVRDVGPAGQRRVAAFGLAGSLRPLPLFERMRGIAGLAAAAGGLQRNARAAVGAFVARVDAWRRLVQAEQVSLRALVRDMYDAYLADAVAEPEDPRAPVGQKTLPPDALWEMVDAILDSLRSAPGVAAGGAIGADVGGATGADVGGGSGGVCLADPDAACSGVALNAFAAQLCLLSSSAEDPGRVSRPDGKQQKKKDKNKKDQPPQAVVITTVHQAKGLEWEHVFVPHFIENILPMGFRSPPEADSKKRAPTAAEVEEYRTQHYREEGRLAYVAITRARRGLYISTLAEYPVFWMRKFFDGECRPSRYLPDIMQPADDKKKQQLAQKGYGYEEEVYYDSEDSDDPRSKRYHKNVAYASAGKSRSDWYRKNSARGRK